MRKNTYYYPKDKAYKSIQKEMINEYEPIVTFYKVG